MSSTKITEYELYNGIRATVVWARELLMGRESPCQRFLIFVAGGSSSGKSTQVADVILKELAGMATIIRADNYYYGSAHKKAMAAKGENYNYDEPMAVNLSLLREHILMLKAGKPIPKLKYSFIRGEAAPDGEIKPAGIIIVEGLFVLEDILIDLADIKIFVDTGMHGRLVRRILRDIERAGQKPIDIFMMFAEVVNPMHELYVANKKFVADLIIKNEYSPEQIPPEKSGLREFQIKFLISDMTDGYLDRIEKKIRRLEVGWGEEAIKRVCVIDQCDTYYNPSDGRDFIKTGEMLRIREEYNVNTGISRILTFKVIQKNNQFIERITPIEFELKDEEFKLFLSLYKNTAKIIKKRRRLYKFDNGRFAGISLALDYVIFGEEYTPDWLLEIRFTKDHTEEQIRELVEADFGGLGLKMADAIKKSYFEM